jgi:glucan phosphoethanolaminetransferase (alkaline phosphatase superfamily)
MIKLKKASLNPLESIRGFAIEFAVWFSLPLIFLYFYSQYPIAVHGLIFAHLKILFSVFLLLCSARVLLPIANCRESLASGIGALLLGGTVFLMVIYYGLVLIGLNAWGHVVSWDLIRSYSLQAPYLAEALGLSLTLVIFVTLFAFVGFVVLAWFALKGSAWPTNLVFISSQAGRLRALGLATVGIALASSLMIWGSFKFPARETGEPLVTTFFPREGVQGFSGFGMDAKAGEKIDLENDQARASYQPNPSAERRNLILIVVDALRPDHMSQYGYARDTTPHLQRLVTDKNIVIRHAPQMRASCSESACGLFSLASSRFFHEVSSRPFTLQQVLKTHGYQINMIMGGDHTNFYGLRELYGEVDFFIDGSDPSAKYSNADRWLVEQTKKLPESTGQPTMIQYHMMSAHPLGIREPAFQKFLPATNYSLSITRPTLKQQNAINYYDNGVLQTDEMIHQLLQTLKQKKYLENALVIITADHGEALGEHGQYSHANGLREAAIRIPFITLSYGHQPESFSTERTSFAQVDVAPTILSDFKMPLPNGWKGKPLQLAKQQDITYLQQGDEIGLFDNRIKYSLWKYWFKSGTNEEFAYELNSDPSEINNLISAPTIDLQLKEWRLLTRKTRPVADGR